MGNRNGRFVKTYAAPVAMIQQTQPAAYIQPMAYGQPAMCGPPVQTFVPPVYGQRHVVAATTIQKGYRARPRACMKVNRQVNRAINQQNRQVNRANRQVKRQNRQAMKAMRRGL